MRLSKKTKIDLLHFRIYFIILNDNQTLQRDTPSLQQNTSSNPAF